MPANGPDSAQDGVSAPEPTADSFDYVEAHGKLYKLRRAPTAAARRPHPVEPALPPPSAAKKDGFAGWMKAELDMD